MSAGGTGPRWRPLLALALVAALTVGAAGVGAAGHAQQEDPTRPTFAVALHEDGSARVTLTVTYDLATDGERRAFERLRNNETALAETRARFADRLERVAARTAERTGREMSVTDASVALREADGTGYVDLSATWTGLARTDGSRLVVAEPFAAGFQPPQSFVVYAPDGYELTTVDPAPDSTGEASATWAADTAVDGFRVVATPTGQSGGAAAGSNTPGFGPVAAGLALLVLSGLVAAARR